MGCGLDRYYRNKLKEMPSPEHEVSVEINGSKAKKRKVDSENKTIEVILYTCLDI